MYEPQLLVTTMLTLINGLMDSVMSRIQILEDLWYFLVEQLETENDSKKVGEKEKEEDKKRNKHVDMLYLFLSCLQDYFSYYHFYCIHEEMEVLRSYVTCPSFTDEK